MIKSLFNTPENSNNQMTVETPNLQFTNRIPAFPPFQDVLFDGG